MSTANEKDGQGIQKSVEYYLSIMAKLKEDGKNIRDFFTHLHRMYKKDKVYSSDLIGVLYVLALGYINSAPQGKKVYAIQQIIELLSIGVDKTTVTEKEDGVDIHLFFPKSGGIETDTKFIPPF